MQLRKLLAEIANTRDVENIPDRLGADLGSKINLLRKEAARADRELDIVHACLTELYNLDANVPTIRQYLNKIKNL